MKKAINRTFWKIQTKRIKSYLTDHPIVKEVVYTCHKGGEYFFVEFVDGIREAWQIRPGVSSDTNDIIAYRYCTKMPMENCIGESNIYEYCEFESGPLGPLEKYEDFFLVRYSDLKKAPFCERRIKIHEIICKLLEVGWKDYEYDNDRLFMEYASLHTSKLDKYSWSANRMYYSAEKVKGRSLIEHFFPVADHKTSDRSIREAFGEPDTLYQAINLLYKRKKNITRSSILRQIQNFPGSRRCGPRMQNPVFWMSFMHNNFPNITSVLDLAPEWGGKLLASAALGTRYLYDSTPHEPFINDMGKFIGAEMKRLDENDDVGLAILSDIDWIPYEILLQRLTEYIGVADNLVIVVPMEDYKRISSVFPPYKKYFLKHSTMISEERMIMLY